MKWPSVKTKIVLRALKKIGWEIRTEKGSHKIMEHPDFDYDFTFHYHNGVEISPIGMALIGKKTGLTIDDL